MTAIVTTVTIEAVANYFGLTRIVNAGDVEYIGANPFESGPAFAGDDGFSLFASGKFAGSAYDRKAKKRYTSQDVATYYGCPYEQYEGYQSDPRAKNGVASGVHGASNSHSNGRQPKASKATDNAAEKTTDGPADSNAAPDPVQPYPIEPKFDDRDLLERGLTREAMRKFGVKYLPGKDNPESWGPHWTWPTYFPDGTEGRHRRKWRYPQRQLTTNSNKKPAKTTWCNRTKNNERDDFGQPLAYNLDKVKKQADVWLVNSELAVWLFWQEKIPAICPLGEGRKVATFVQVMQVLKEHGTQHIHVLLDNDKGGVGGAVNAVDAAREVGVGYTVYDMTHTGKLGFDASDLYEYWQATCDPQNPTPFRQIILEQPTASDELIEVWRRGYRTLVEQQSKAAQEEKYSRTLDRAGRVNKVTTRKCPTCKKQAVVWNEVKENWVCIERFKGCGAEFDKGATEIVKQEPKGGKDNAATELLELVKGNQMFHTTDGTGYIVVNKNNRRVTLKIESDEFSNWCKYLYIRDKETVVAPDSVKSMISTLNAISIEEGQELEAHVRCGSFGGRIYIDLANKNSDVVEIDEAGWRIISQPPIYFRRATGMNPLPVPEAANNEETWTKFREIINVGDDRNWMLLVSWMCFALIPPAQDIDCPILSVHGQQGSAKSTLCRIVRETIDSNAGYMVSYVKEEKDVIIAAENGRIFCLDNLTTIPVWLSNLLAAMVTGTPHRCRQLFTDDGTERFYRGQPALIINGIPDQLGGIDLNDRAIKLNVPVLADGGYRSKQEVLSTWRALWPNILAAIFDAMSAGLANRENIQREYGHLPFPRMYDFLLFSMACTERLPWSPTDIYEAYTGNIKTSALVDTDDLLGRSLLTMLDDSNGYYKGYSSVMYNELYKLAADSYIDMVLYETSDVLAQRKMTEDARRMVQDNKSFPGTPERLGVALRKVAPSLRKLGINVEFDRDKGGAIYSLQRIEAVESEQTALVLEPADGAASVNDPFADE